VLILIKQTRNQSFSCEGE